MKVLYSLVLFSLAVFICKESIADYYDKPQVFLKDSIIIYEGILNKEGFYQIKNAMQRSKKEIRWLYINSAGGEIGVSMDIGLLVFKKRLNVRVSNVCLSSCANYIFPAGKKKVIGSNGIVAWHGSAIQKDIKDYDENQLEKALSSIDDPAQKEIEKRKVIDKFNDYLAAMKKKQTRFFKTIGVDQDITILGQKETYNVDGFWALSVKDMETFGVTNVEAPDDYPKKIAAKYGQVTYIQKRIRERIRVKP